MPYLPGEDFGNGVLQAMEGAISPMVKIFDELDNIDRLRRPHRAGLYKVLVSYLQTREDPLLGEMKSYSDFHEIGSYELVDPKLFFKGLVVKKTVRAPNSTGYEITINASGSGNSVSLDAKWIKTFNGTETPMGATGSATLDLPQEIVWTREDVEKRGTIRVSGSTFGQERENKKSTFGINYQNGFTLVTSIQDLVATNTNGSLLNRKGLGGVAREGSVTRELYNYKISMPSMFYADGHPKRRGGWHLRDPKSIWAITHLIELGGGFGAYGGAYAFAIYGSDPDGVVAEPSEPEGREEEVLQESPTPAELAENSEATSAEVTGRNEITTPELAESVRSLPTNQSANFNGNQIVTNSSQNAGSFNRFSGSSPQIRLPEPLANSVPVSAVPLRVVPQSTSTPIATRNASPASSNSATPSVGSSGSNSGALRTSSSSSTDVVQAVPIINLTPERSRGGTPGENQELEDALAINNPDLVPPNHPRVARIISAWVGHAEPPQNADPSVKLRYNEWGTLVGQAKGGIIRQTQKPDDAVGISSSEYLWKHRRNLNSLGHCQLGDWVMAELRGESLSGCSYQFPQTGPVPVPDVVGKSIDAAEQALTAVGLVPVIEIGPPASSLALEGNVSGQDPRLGSRIKKGGVVAIEVFTNYTGSSKVPDLAGLTIDQAENKLEEFGFKLELKLGDPAPSRNSQERIQKQAPTANSGLQENGIVTLWIYAPFVEKEIVVPEMVGASLSEIQSMLDRLNLRLTVLTGGEAPSRDYTGKTERQLPEAGTQINEGETVQIWVYSEYIEKIYAPNLVGVQANEAELIALENGLTFRSVNQKTAPSPAYAFTVASQLPQAGTELQLLDEIQVVIYK
jgi:beta-lactam-binding protein with PASTA domain